MAICIGRPITKADLPYIRNYKKPKKGSRLSLVRDGNGKIKGLVWVTKLDPKTFPQHVQDKLPRFSEHWEAKRLLGEF